jgi:hypothetical protein
MHMWFVDAIATLHADFAGVGQVSALLDRQRVYICSQEDGFTRPTGEHGSDVMVANGGVNLKGFECLSVFYDCLCGCYSLEGESRMGVEPLGCVPLSTTIYSYTLRAYTIPHKP